MIVGHEKIIENLKISADNKNLSHGYIFWGQPRVGKKQIALALANYLETGIFDSKRFLSDLLFIEPRDTKNIGIDSVKEIKNFLMQKPSASFYRAVIINNGESMTTEAQNALLKITEEPPTKALIILVISDPEKIMPTISSRLPKIYFSSVPNKTVKSWLEKEFRLNGRQADILANQSNGQPGLAWAILKDEKFKKIQDDIKNIFKLGFWEKRDFIKNMTNEDNFEIIEFLEALLIQISNDLKTNSRYFDLWHKAIELQRQLEFFNLNPRLQVENLLASL